MLTTHPTAVSLSNFDADNDEFDALFCLPYVYAVFGLGEGLVDGGDISGLAKFLVENARFGIVQFFVDSRDVGRGQLFVRADKVAELPDLT